MIVKLRWLDSAIMSIDKERSPSQTLIFDFHKQKPYRRLVRIAIEQNGDCFSVKKWEIKESVRNMDMSVQLLFSSKHAWEANEKVEEVSTCLEQESWVCINDESYTIYDVDKELQENHVEKCDCVGVGEYYAMGGMSGDCKIRQVPKGYFCIMTIDPYGIARIRKDGCKPCIAPKSVSEMYKNIINKKGARGFAAEGIFDGARFFMTDVIYAHNKWVNKLDFKTREMSWRNYTDKKDAHNNHMLKMHTATKPAIAALFNTDVDVMMVYDKKGRVVVCNDHPKTVNIGGEKKPMLYNDEFKKLGAIRQPGELDLSYVTLKCLSLKTGNLGLEGVFF